jgi:hypothetical protein
MEGIHYLIYLEARQLYTEARLSAAEILVEVSTDAVTALIRKSGEEPAAIDDARRGRFAEKLAQDAVLDYARTEIPVTSNDCYDFRVNLVSNPQLITSRVPSSATSDGCRLWLLKKHEFPQQA